MPDIDDTDLLLQRFYGHVNARGGDVYLSQPHHGGQVTTYTFAEVFDQAARMAGHLSSLGFPRQSKIAIISKNCAHFFMAELAIWMSGHVTVALFPTLSAGTVRYILEHMPRGPVLAPAGEPQPGAAGFAAVEGWRGEIVAWLQAGPAGEVNRVMVRDPSAVNWVGLERAMPGNIVPDFPLCNKSFNQSYSGHDL